MFRCLIGLCVRNVSGLAFVGAALAVSVALAQAPGGLQNPVVFRATSTRPTAPSQVYDFHYNFFVPQSWMYPSYRYPYVHGGPNPSFQIERNPTPTAAEPYPPDYHVDAVAPPPLLEDTVDLRDSQGVVHVFVPMEDAVVYLNGQEVPGSGTHRRIELPILTLKSDFQYFVTMTYERDGEKTTDYRRIVVGAGEYTVADFTRPALIVRSARLPSGPLNPRWIAKTTTPYRTPWTPPWSPQ
jgi:uncharacterized protein (TIGR03000 family)